MSSANTESPKTFISYSWSSPEHEAWVLSLASQLVESGVDVIFDKWDLVEGADKYAFMERMVTDRSVKKVIVICDKVYAEKADGREGGVGTETQIISGELYSQVDAAQRHQKFVALITERNEQGKPYMPTFMRNRIYIDMSDSEGATDAFEKLLRWIYDKPLYRKPERGDPPAYLFSDAVISLGTTARFQRAVDAVKQGKANAIGALKDYFDTFTANLENFRLKENDTELDDQIIESINSFLPYRNEAVEILLDVARYQASQDAWDAIHGFLEKLLPYCFWPAGETVWGRWQSENLRFITHELFLYSVAALLKHERFEAVRQLTEQAYFMPVGSPEIDSGMIPFTCFRSYLRPLEHRNKRLNLRQFNLTADLLQKRAIIKELKYDDLMQADFILFLHEELRLGDERWIPDTLLYAERHRVFEVFARAESSNYFMKLRIALGVTQKAELEQLMQRYKTGDLKLPRWGFGSFDPARLMGIERIASTP